MKTASCPLTILSLLVLCSSCTPSSVRLDAPRIKDLKRQLAAAGEERQAAQEAFAAAMREGTSQPERQWQVPPEDARVYEQLDTVVDLSALSPDMPFKEAIEIIRSAVEPPLNIVVLWRVDFRIFHDALCRPGEGFQ